MTAPRAAPGSPRAPLPLADDFAGDRPRGQVVPGGDGASPRRVGVDVEGVMSVDRGGLRLRPLAQPGWGRTALAYGPYRREPGLSAAFSVLNSHHASEHAEAWPPLGTYLKQVLRGTQVDPLPHRLLHRPRYPARESLRRRVQAWRGHHRAAGDPDAAANLAVGWLAAEAPASATGGGQGLVVRSAHGENGDLLAEVGGGRVLAQDRLQNLPLHVLVVLRERGASYWAASLPGATGLSALPALRPLALDTDGEATELWAGVHQRVSGQVGWSIDTRAHAARVARPGPWSHWWTTAHAADRPAGGRPQPGAGAAHGGRWEFEADVALLRPPGPTGLLRASTTGGDVGLVLRAGPAAATSGGAPHLLVRLEASREGARLVVERREGCGLAAEHLADVELDGPAEAGGGPRDLQVVDDGQRLRVLVDGRLVLGPLDVGAAPPAATGVGVWLPGPHTTLVELEAHPLRLDLPAELELPELPVAEGTVERFAEDFTVAGSTPRHDLEGHVGPGGPWRRSVGERPFSLGPGGVAVPPPAAPPPSGTAGRLGPARRLAALARPGGERIAYTVAWPDPHLADLSVDVLPPGSARHQNEGSRAGLIFWQDEDTYLMVNVWLDDAYDGTSISSFLRIGGYEDVFDAVWTNVGRRVTWGQPFRLRTSFDGDLHTTWVDGEPVLYRRVGDVLADAARLRICRVGLLANWEFGQDTGSRFLRIRASS